MIINFNNPVKFMQVYQQVTTVDLNYVNDSV